MFDDNAPLINPEAREILSYKNYHPNYQDVPFNCYLIPLIGSESKHAQPKTHYLHKDKELILSFQVLLPESQFNACEQSEPKCCAKSIELFGQGLPSKAYL